MKKRSAARACWIFFPFIEPEVSTTNWIDFGIALDSSQRIFGASIMTK